MKLRTLLIASGVALSLATVVKTKAATFTTIDNFTVPSPTQSVTDAGAGFASDNKTGLLTNTISGERTITALRTGGTGSVQARVDQTGQTFNVDAGSATAGVGTIEWNIPSPTDLTAGGATAFEFNVTNNDQGATIVIEVESSAGTSTFSSGLIVGGTVGVFTAFFDEFTGSAVFTLIERIKITITNENDTDFAMQAFLTTEPQDFGDAPDSGVSPNGSGTNAYCTTLANNGPRHIISTDNSGNIVGPLIGTSVENVDSETDGLASSDAQGDDNSPNPAAAADDETGVNNFDFRAGSSDSGFDLHVTGATGLVNAWIDFNGDGDFADVGEQVLTDASRNVGTHSEVISVPVTANLGSTFMRVRISTAGGDDFKTTGLAAADGEVEDHQITIDGEDYGDAPNSYFTLFNATASVSGPIHPIVSGATILGATVDAEGDGAPSTGADGDDLANTDDEDGVVGLPTVITTAGGLFPYTVEVSVANADIYAWADFGQDGTFAPFSEEIIGQFGGSSAHTAGVPQAHTLTVPGGLTAGTPIYLRFRAINSGDPALTFPTEQSSASNGEVEDYVIQVVTQLQDWGDNPDTYTTIAGPRHNIGTGDPQFGTERDAETAGQASTASDGDDTTDSPDDEDGVDFASLGTINPGATISLPIVTSGMGGSINAWMDFNGNGVYDVPAEQVLTDAAAGAGTYSITIPVTAVTGTTHARFRISSAGGDLASSGTAADGEIEDYAFTITPNLDFGDAPDTYGTLLTSNGPRHSITGPGLGTNIDNESDGVPSSGADGDDTAGSPDDEDAVTFPACLTAGIANNIPITVNGTGKLSLWIDLNGDGDFLDSGEMLINNLPHTGTASFPILIPTTATPGATYARARVIASSDPNLTSPLGAASSGEVEDYAVSICKDFGDAPDSYCTLLASDGPRHDGTGPRLGTLRDLETDAPASLGALADGDDNAGSDDEDGVSFSNSGVFDTTSSSNQITFTLSGTADVEVYVDWNRDGDFEDVGEKYDFDSHSGGTESLSVGTLSTDGVTYVRVRAYSVGDAVDSPKGNAISGEVEDYRITLSTPTLVDLVAFDAVATETDQVAINWSTGAEIDTAGFNLIRRQATEDSAASYDPVTLNSQLIPSKGTSLEGASYDYMDSPGYGTFFYQLEDIETSGRVGLHPFREVTILPTLRIGLEEDSRVNLNYVVLPGWDYEVEYKSLAEKDADWQALPDAPHNNGVVSDEAGNDTSDRLYRLKASPRQ